MKILLGTFIGILMFGVVGRAQDPVKILSVAQLSLGLADSIQTEHDFKRGNFIEHDPIIRPLLNHPAALYALNAGNTVAMVQLAHRLKNSHNKVLKRIWWLPQVANISGSIFGFVETRRHYQEATSRERPATEHQ